MKQNYTENLIKILKEEVQDIDLSTYYSTQNHMQEISIIACQDMVVSGIKIIEDILKMEDESAVVKVINPDGFFVEKNDIIAIIKGNINVIIKLEKLIYNIVESMSGIASKVNDYTKKLNDSNVKLIDTRNDIPGSRFITKQAFLDAGGINHYGNLSDHIFINMHHKKIYSTFQNAIDHIKENIDHSVNVTIEIDNENDFIEAIETTTNIIIINNFKPDTLESLLNKQFSSKLFCVNVDLTTYDFEDYLGLNTDFLSIPTITENFKRKTILIKYI